MSQGYQRAVHVLSSLRFVHLSSEGSLDYYSAMGRRPEFRGWPGRMGTLLRSRAPSNRQMKTKEDEKRVEARCELLTFWVSILNPLHRIPRADAVPTLLWSPEMGFGNLVLFPPQKVQHWSLTRKSALALIVKTLSKGVALHCTLPTNTKMSIIKLDSSRTFSAPLQKIFIILKPLL